MPPIAGQAQLKDGHQGLKLTRDLLYGEILQDGKLYTFWIILKQKEMQYLANEMHTIQTVLQAGSQLLAKVINMK